MAKSTKYRSIFLSDIHLGTRGCQADTLLDFIKHNDAEKIYLVGDIVDGWRLKKSWYWPQAHNDVVQKLLRKARKGSEVIFIPGNHDEFLREYIGTHFGGIEVRTEAIHEAGDGRRYLVLHGDQFDCVVKYAKWLAVLGDWAYTVLLGINTYLNIARRKLGFSYWSLSAYLKMKAKNAVQYIASFEEAVAHEAKSQGVDGVICGHIHHAEIRDIDGMVYMNDGDWVESCTALVEHSDGQFEIIRWAEEHAKETGKLAPQSVSDTNKAAA